MNVIEHCQFNNLVLNKRLSNLIDMCLLIMDIACVRMKFDQKVSPLEIFVFRLLFGFVWIVPISQIIFRLHHKHISQPTFLYSQLPFYLTYITTQKVLQ